MTSAADCISKGNCNSILHPTCSSQMWSWHSTNKKWSLIFLFFYLDCPEWFAWQTEYVRGNALGFLRLGHRQPCGFYLSILMIALGGSLRTQLPGSEKAKPNGEACVGLWLTAPAHNQHSPLPTFLFYPLSFWKAIMNDQALTINEIRNSKWGA